jgi:hypothetical protein
MLDLRRRGRVPGKYNRKLASVFGKLRMRVTRTRCYSTLNGHTDVLPYRVVASNAEGAVVVGHSLPDWLTTEEQIQHVRFVTPNLYWVCLGGIHEYFRRVKTPSNNEMQRTRSAPVRKRGPRR